MIARALEEAPHRHAYDRTLTARVTVICVLVACMFPGAGYDMALAAAFGLPGLSLKPGTAVPSGPAFSKARSLLGERVITPTDIQALADRHKMAEREGRPFARDNLHAAIMEGAVERVRPKMITVVAIMAGLRRGESHLGLRGESPIGVSCGHRNVTWG